jgi:hypothetical protein
MRIKFADIRHFQNAGLLSPPYMSISSLRMLAYAIGVCIHPRLAACIEKEHTLASVRAYASCIEKEETHALAYADAHAGVCINPRLVSRIKKDGNSECDPQKQNFVDLRAS